MVNTNSVLLGALEDAAATGATPVKSSSAGPSSAEFFVSRQKETAPVTQTPKRQVAQRPRIKGEPMLAGKIEAVKLLLVLTTNELDFDDLDLDERQQVIGLLEIIVKEAKKKPQ